MILLKLSHTFNGWRRSPQRLPRNHTSSSLVPQFRCNVRAPGSIPIPVPIQLYLVFASDSTFQLRPWLTTWKSCFFHLHWQVLLRIKLAISGYHDQQHFRSLLIYSTLSHWQCWHYLAISRWSRFQRPQAFLAYSSSCFKHMFLLPSSDNQSLPIDVPESSQIISYGKVSSVRLCYRVDDPAFERTAY